MAGYYDKNKDYSKELQRTDLSSSERERLTQERQNKINDRYGGKEPAMVGSNKTYSQTYGGSSGGSSGRTDYHAEAIRAAQSGDWDAVQRALSSREQKVSSTGQNYGKTSAEIYADLWKQYGQQTGGIQDMLDELQGLYGDSGAYARALEAQQAANQAGVEKAVGALEAQKKDTETSYADLFRQLYLNKMNNQKNIGQMLAAQGKTGGAAESTMLNLSASYEDALRQGEQGRIGAISGLDQAITDARLTGDITDAEAAAANAKERANSYAGVLQNLINRYDTLAAQEAARKQESASDARAYAYKTAMQILSGGNMASDDLLAEAGISRADAAAIVAAAAAQRRQSSSGGSGSGGGSTGMKLSVAKDLASQGIFNQEVLDAFYRSGYSDEYLTGKYGYDPYPAGPGLTAGAMNAVGQAIAEYAAAGNADAIAGQLDNVWNQMSAAQRQAVQNMLARYNASYDPSAR